MGSKLKAAALCGAFAAGVLSAPLVVKAAGFLTSGLTTATPGGAYTHLDSFATVPVDTGLANGSNPQSISAEGFRLAALAAPLFSNTATASAGAATLSRLGGTVTSEALTTVAGATYTLTLTNTLVSATSRVLVDVANGTNTATQASTLQVTSVTPGSGSVVIVVTNGGTATLNGTILVSFAMVK